MKRNDRKPIVRVMTLTSSLLRGATGFKADTFMGCQFM
jgi:hypothetical protein